MRIDCDRVAGLLDRARRSFPTLFFLNGAIDPYFDCCSEILKGALTEVDLWTNGLESIGTMLARESRILKSKSWRRICRYRRRGVPESQCVEGPRSVESAVYALIVSEPNKVIVPVFQSSHLASSLCGLIGQAAHPKNLSVGWRQQFSKWSTANCDLSSFIVGLAKSCSGKCTQANSIRFGGA